MAEHLGRERKVLAFDTVPQVREKREISLGLRHRRRRRHGTVPPPAAGSPKVADGSLCALGQLVRLRQLQLANMFAIEEVAYLAARLTGEPDDTLRAHIISNIPCKSCGTQRSNPRRAP